MKIAVGSDEKTSLTEVVIEELLKRGHLLKLFGPLKDESLPWTLVAEQLGDSIIKGENQEGVLFCYTGTGASIAANKIPGIRAALCNDAETARGARWWNNANVLVMSLRATSHEIAKEILDAWFSEKVLKDEKSTINHLHEIENRHR